MCVSPAIFHINTFCLVSLVLHAATTRHPRADLAAQRAPATAAPTSTAQAVAAALLGRARTVPQTVEVASTGRAAQVSVLAHAPTAARVAPAHTATAAAVSALALVVDAQTSECLAWNL